MFLRSSVVKKAGKTYRYWKLVENVRTDAGPRQQAVAHLGDLANFTAAEWRALAGRMGEPAVAALIAVNRLVEPMPEWPMVRWWQRTALPQLLGIPLGAINDDRLYRCLDMVLPHKQAIEERIAGVGQSLF